MTSNRLIVRPGLWAYLLVFVFLAGETTAARAEPAATVADYDSRSAVALIYHRFGDGRYPSTNIRLDQFDSHIEELTSGGYNVVRLSEIVTALEEERSLPDRTVAITIDDGYRSVYTEAWPRLKEAGLPFTLFIATDPIDEGFDDMLSWDELREMAADGVEIAHHSAAHPHLPELDEEAMAADLDLADRRMEAELGLKPDLFAYPYGEYGSDIRARIVARGFRAAFGQQSGVINPAADRFALPRFAMNEAYGDLGRLRLATQAKPLPVRDLTPADPVLSPANNPPPVGLTFAAPLPSSGAMNCFASHEGGPLHLERLGERRVEIRLKEPFPPGRGRVNCTIPAGDGRWRWFGYQFYIPG